MTEIEQLRTEIADVRRQLEKANALLRWGTFDMTPAAVDDWKKRAEAHLSDGPQKTVGQYNDYCR